MQILGRKLPRPMLVLLVAGAIIVVASLPGLIYYGELESQPKASTFYVAWSESYLSPSVKSGTAYQGKEADAKVEIPNSNITGILFNITTEDYARVQGLNGAGLTIRIIAPNGTKMKEIAGLSGNSFSSIKVQICAKPNQSQISAYSQDGAADALAADYQNTNGTGTWTVEIYYTRAVNSPLPSNKLDYIISALPSSYSASVSAQKPKSAGQA